MEHQGCDNEESKNDDLEDQAAHNDVRTKLGVHGVIPHASLNPQSRTARLDNETENVAEYENACKPSGWYYGAMSGVKGADKSAERHVQGCRKENGSKEEQGRLQDIWDKYARGIMCQCSAHIAYDLDCK